MRILPFVFMASILCMPGLSFAAITLKLGNVTVSPGSLTSGGCIQVPVIINDSFSRDLRDITFTLALSGDTGIIAGGVATNMLVANGYAPLGAGTGVTGITNPGTNLANSNGLSTPNCSTVFNRATQGSGTPINFARNSNTFANWSINNNSGGVGRKQAFLIDAVNNASLGTTVANTDTLIAVLEIPIISNPGAAELFITATPDATVSNGNIFTYESGVQIVQKFILPPAPAKVKVGDLPIRLKLGDVTVEPGALVSGGCIQVPVIINDPISRDLRDITFTLELSGDTGIIAGGVATNMLVANGYAPLGAGTGVAGITNPGTNLANSNGLSTPNCSTVFNRATQGSGTPINFAPNSNVFANWSINNNLAGLARKRAFLIDAVNNASLGTTVANTDTLIAVLEIPIIVNPGTAKLLISAVPVDSLSGGNTYTFSNGIQSSDNFVLPFTPSIVELLEEVIFVDGFE